MRGLEKGKALSKVWAICDQKCKPSQHPILGHYWPASETRFGGRSVFTTFQGNFQRVCFRYSKTCLKRPLKSWFSRPIIAYNADQKYCRMLQESILQYFCFSLSYLLFLRPLFCLFLIGRLRQVLLYTNVSSAHFPPFTTNVICFLICLCTCTLIAYIAKDSH